MSKLTKFNGAQHEEIFRAFALRQNGNNRFKNPEDEIRADGNGL